MVIHRHMTGFTTIELMTVVVVVGILAMIAVPSFSNMMANNRIKSASSNLHISLLKARSEAIKRNASVTVTPNAGGWVSGWRILVGATELGVEGAPQGVTIVTTPNPLAAITYRSSGRVQWSPSSIEPPKFQVRDTGEALSPEHRRCVTVSLSGLPAVKGGSC
jgi:type IV fimbrial biogenesis protein FimT